VSVLRYNGIQLEIVRVVSYERRPVFDGFAYQYTRHVVTVDAVFAPGATSYDFTPDATSQAGVDPPEPFDPESAPGGGPTAQGARPTNSYETALNANLTDRAVRHLLMQPRARLVVTAGGPESGPDPYRAYPTFRGGAQASVILDVPERTGKAPPPPLAAGNPGGDVVEADEIQGDPDPAGHWGGEAYAYVCDATGGPRPLACDVRRVDGTGTFRVRYSIQADVHEASFFYNRPPVMLSHVWSMDLDVDAEGFATRTVSGRAVFRRDVLEQQSVRPDDFRSLLVHPLVRGMKRESLKVSQLEDGNTLRYQIVDREFTHRILYPNVMRVEAFCRLGVRRTSAERAAVTVTAAVAAAAARNLAGAVYNILPTAYVDAVVRLWGNQLSTLRSLRDMGTRILLNRLGDVTRSQHSIAADEGYDWAGRYVELHWRIELSGITGAADVTGLARLANDPVVLNALPDPRKMKNFARVLDDSTVENNADGKAPAYAPFRSRILDAELGAVREGRGFRTLMQAGQITGEDYNKGTYFGAVVAQLFADSAANPPVPPAVEAVRNLKQTFY
jgi:hypothetical protein